MSVPSVRASYPAAVEAVREFFTMSRTLERGCRLVVTSEGPEEERD